MENSQKQFIKAAIQPPKYYIGRVEHNYIFLTPKIIKFSYPPFHQNIPTSTPPKQNLTLPPTPQKQSSFKKITLISREGKKKRSRTNKIALVSRTTERSELRGDDSVLSNSKKQSGSKSSQIVKSRYLKTEHHYTYALPNHINVEPLLPSISCDLFSNCNEVETAQKDEIYLSLYKHKEGKIQQEERSLTDSGKLQNRFTNNRKKIFMDSVEKATNKSVDVCNRSRSRKSIFAPLQKHSFSLDRSVSMRKKIFSKSNKAQKKCEITKKEVIMEQCDIPSFVIENWQQMEEGIDEAVADGSSRRYMRMVESQVKRI